LSELGWRTEASTTRIDKPEFDKPEFDKPEFDKPESKGLSASIV
jgi:hypothetical protein